MKRTGYVMVSKEPSTTLSNPQLREGLSQNQVEQLYQISKPTIRKLTNRGLFRAYDFPYGIKRKFYLKKEVDQAFEKIAQQQAQKGGSEL